MPPTETLEAFATTLAIDLSGHVLADVAARLVPFYCADCPAAVVFRASWPDERIVHGTLGDIAEAMAQHPIERTAIIFVGAVLGEEDFRESALYSVDYQRRFRGRAS